ncbi:thiol-disulfide oxidoreductase DCC family protein [Salinicola aestuarinus]|uniref:thiol-disulfide oxidoreductase DCC family protein n=1 Tax=Salinicola aestuarinus TaxID=1949082 RepID=UPI000DA1C9FA|nr:DUF393 domain-containing protein [Salinicola aestuarinus]
MNSARPTIVESSTNAEPRSAGVDGLLLFDAGCPFCRRSVRWFLARERRDSRLTIAGLETPLGERLGRHFTFDPSLGDSIRYVTAGCCHRDSEALWRLCERLDGSWGALARMQQVPRPLRDGVYRFVGRHRSRLAPSDDDRLESHPRWIDRLGETHCQRLGLPASLADGAPA